MAKKILIRHVVIVLFFLASTIVFSCTSGSNSVSDQFHDTLIKTGTYLTADEVLRLQSVIRKYQSLYMNGHKDDFYKRIASIEVKTEKVGDYFYVRIARNGTWSQPMIVFSIQESGDAATILFPVDPVETGTPMSSKEFDKECIIMKYDRANIGGKNNP